MPNDSLRFYDGQPSGRDTTSTRFMAWASVTSLLSAMYGHRPRPSFSTNHVSTQRVGTCTDIDSGPRWEAARQEECGRHPVSLAIDRSMPPGPSYATRRYRLQCCEKGKHAPGAANAWCHAGRRRLQLQYGVHNTVCIRCGHARPKSHSPIPHRDMLPLVGSHSRVIYRHGRFT